MKKSANRPTPFFSPFPFLFCLVTPDQNRAAGYGEEGQEKKKRLGKKKGKKAKGKKKEKKKKK